MLANKMPAFASKRLQKGKQNNVSIRETIHSGVALRCAECSQIRARNVNLLKKNQIRKGGWLEYYSAYTLFKKNTTF